MCTACLVVLYAEAFLNVLSGLLTLAIFIRVLSSWAPLRLPWGLGELVFAITEPLLAPIRRALPPAAGMDFSPLVALVGIQLLTSLLLRLLPPVL